MHRQAMGVFAVLLGAAMLVAGGRVAAASGGVTDLGTLGGSSGWMDSEPNAVNSEGMVVGSALTADGQTHAFAWTPWTGMVDLGTFGGTLSSAQAVNDKGQVVGAAQTASGVNHPFLWTAAGGMVDLGTLGGTATATAINDQGQVVGEYATASGASHAFSWTATGGMVDLGTLGGSFSQANAINDNGQVMGESSTPGDGSDDAFVWSAGGGMLDLGTLHGASTYNDQTLPMAINGSGEVVGVSPTASWDGLSAVPLHAFLWSPSAGMIDIDPLGGSDNSLATGINDNGQVIGVDGAQHAFLRSPTGGTVYLGTLGGDTSWPTAINDDGEVVGYSLTSSGEEEAFSWTAAGGMVALGDNGSSSNISGYPFASSAWRINGTGEIVGTVAAGGGAIHAAAWNVPPSNPPTVASIAPSHGPVGSTIAVSGTHFTGATGVTVGGVPAGFTTVSDSEIAVVVPNGALSGPVAVTAGGATGQSAGSFIVDPTVGAISGLPADPVQLGSPVSPSVGFTAPANTSATVTWSWGDGTTSTGVVSETAGAGSATGQHTYAAPGVYPVSVTVADSDGGSGSGTYDGDVVVYDPSAGFVTGGGWITSPAGACLDPSVCPTAATGKGTFGFVSRYQTGATVPSGSTQYVFHDGGFNFSSTSYQWLVVNQNASNAQFKGAGTINGAGQYTFMVWASTGSPGTFRLQITNANTGTTVYDTGSQNLGGGSVIIHTS